MLKALPTLYKKTSAGKIQMWSIAVRGTKDGPATIETNFGQVDGKIQTTSDTIAEGKNSGKANETTAYTQALAEAQSSWDGKKKKGYVETVSDASSGVVDAIIEGGINPMLAKKFEEDGGKIKYPAYLSRKLDGVRCVATVKSGKCTLWTRTRKQITTMPHIQKAVEKIYSGDVILDGEIYHSDYAQNFEGLVSIVRDVAGTEDRERLQYHVFDVVNDLPFSERLKEIKQLIGKDPAIEVVAQVLVKDSDEVLKLSKEYLKEGYEGGMIKNAGSLYEFKRSSHLVKVKFTLEEEFEIIGVDEGRGKLTGHAGSFICKTKDGAEFNVKMSGETEKLKEYFENIENYIGQMLTVTFQGYTNKSSVPRFPVGKAIRSYE
jgi:ATP-dependent DNA ligase